MIIVKNSDLGTETISALNNLIELDINATVAFKLSRIIKDISSIVEDKVKTEKKILDKWVQKGEDGKPIVPVGEDGKPLEDSVTITDVNAFTKEMEELMSIETTLVHSKLNFDDMQLNTAKIKDIIKLEFLFQ